MSAYNYAKAFLLYHEGTSFEDVSTTLGIPLDTLKTEARQHGWNRLTDRLTAPVRALAKVDVDLDLIKLNRSKSLKEAEPIEVLFGRRMELYHVAWDELQAAEAQWVMDQQEYSDGPKSDEDKIKLDGARSRIEQSRMAAAPSPKSLAELGKAVAILQDIRYRALGDVISKTASDDKADPKQARTLIQINFPSAIQRNRMERAIEVQTVQREELSPES